MKFRSHGGAMVAPLGTDKTTVINAVNTMTMTSVGTPLGDQLYDAGQYYQGRYSGYSSPIQYVCQPNFVLMVSDGLHLQFNKDVRSEATARFAEDHASALQGMQNLILHTVGFGIDASEQAAANDVLQQAATNGGGIFYTAHNSAQLETTLQEAISQIIAATFSFAAPTIPTGSITEGARAYFAAFQTDPARPFWRGFLKAYQRDASGRVPVDTHGVPLAAALVWEAGQQLNQKLAASRLIFTSVAGSMEEFLRSNGTITATLLGVSHSTERDTVIDFVRGIDAVDEDADGNVTEERAWKLGDIFHASPVLVTPPRMPLADPSYSAFRQSHAHRTTVLLAGANDGMLHAFRASDGEELWAFIPPDLLSRLQALTRQSREHPFYVDASPIAADIRIGNTWKTIVVFGERRGGRYYHALDITDITTPRLLWSFTDPKMGETWSEPALGRVQFPAGTEKFVAFVGGGYDTNANNGSGKAFFVIDLATGQKLWEYSGHDMNFSLAASPAAVDLNNDGFIDRVYVGDVGGQLWRFDVSSAAPWTGKRLFVAAPSQQTPPPTGEYYPAQAIYAPPALAFDKGGTLWVYFGTGDRNHPNHTSTNRFYGIKDDTTRAHDTALTESSLVDVTSANATAEQGWFFRLASHEKVLAAADVFNEMVLFSTFTPTNTHTCEEGAGTAKLYAVQMLTGYAAVDHTTGRPLTTPSSTTTRSQTVGAGIASKPIVILQESDTTITTSVLVATTGQQLPSTPTPPPALLRRLLFWREVF